MYIVINGTSTFRHQIYWSEKFLRSWVAGHQCSSWGLSGIFFLTKWSWLKDKRHKLCINTTYMHKTDIFILSTTNSPDSILSDCSQLTTSFSHRDERTGMDTFWSSSPSFLTDRKYINYHFHLTLHLSMHNWLLNSAEKWEGAPKGVLSTHTCAFSRLMRERKKALSIINGKFCNYCC